MEMRGTLAPEVQRVVRAYETARPSSEDKPQPSRSLQHKIKSRTTNQRSSPSAYAVSPISGARPPQPPIQLHQQSKPKPMDGSEIGPPPTGPDWTPIITANNQPLISIREHPSRQVWIGVTSPTLARSPDFVILWTNALDWIANASLETFTAKIVGTLSPRDKPDSGRDQWPGFYHDDAGTQIAANAPPANFSVAASNASPQDVRRKFATLTASRPGGIDLAPSLAVAAIGCILLAACLWPSGRAGGRTRRILTAFSAPRTV